MQFDNTRAWSYSPPTESGHPHGDNEWGILTHDCRIFRHCNNSDDANSTYKRPVIAMDRNDWHGKLGCWKRDNALGRSQCRWLIRRGGKSLKPMSVRPILFHESGDVDVVYDEGGHSGTIPAAEVQWSTNIDGSPSHQFIVLPCPDGCGATSTWPVGGGADAINGQQMFVNKVVREGCACGNIPASTNAVPDAHVHLLVARMDGESRWSLG